MDTILLLVRNLVFLVMLSAFLEMLLPLQGTRRFVQVIIGLFLLLAVLGPIVALFRQQPPLNFAMSGNAGGSAEMRSILEQGQALQQVTSAQEQATYIRRLEDQIDVMCRLVPGVKAAKTTVALNASRPQQSLGAVQKVMVVLQIDEKQVAHPVETVRIGSAPEATAPSPVSQKEIADQVRETVASLFGLQQEQVIVNFEKTR